MNTLYVKSAAHGMSASTSTCWCHPWKDRDRTYPYAYEYKRRQYRGISITREREWIKYRRWKLKIKAKGDNKGVYDDSGFYMSEREERPDGSRLFRFVGGKKSGRRAQKRVHFIGIGGAGLSSLAALALHEGWVVTGSDIKSSDKINYLKEQGANVQIGHKESNLFENIGEAGSIDPLPDAVVVSSAVRHDNIELFTALKYNIPIYKRGAWISRVTHDYETISVAGTHGKTTTSAMMALAMQKLYGDINAVVGGDVPQFAGGSGCLHGSSKWFILEADEYDRTFLNINSAHAIVTNVELDHVDIFEDEQDVFAAFTEFLKAVHSGGITLMCGDDPGCKRIIEGLENEDDTACQNVLHYGFSEGNHWRAKNMKVESGKTTFDVEYNNHFLGQISTSLLGKHNVLNALSVIALASMIALNEKQLLGPDLRSQQLDEVSLPAWKGVVDIVGRALGEFLGVDRRCQVIGMKEGCTVISDYAHHPTEIRAILNAMQDRYEDHKVFVVFEPHTVSRVTQFLKDFALSFVSCDKIYVSKVYDTMNEDSDDIGKNLSLEISKYISTVYVEDHGELVQHILYDLSNSPSQKNVVLVLGAGRANIIARQIYDNL